MTFFSLSGAGDGDSQLKSNPMELFSTLLSSSTFSAALTIKYIGDYLVPYNLFIYVFI